MDGFFVGFARVAEWSNATVCKTVNRRFESFPVHRRKMKEIFMETSIKSIGSVERNKAASEICKRLFPLWSKPHTQGELQRIIIEAKNFEASDKEIERAGNWWLWVRNLAIENTFEKQMKFSLMKIAVKAAVGIEAVNIVSCRSPELLHAQVSGQGDLSLPRSRKAIAKLEQIISCSSKFLPTTMTIVFADLAIDNLEEIEKHCDIDLTINKNIEILSNICQEIGIPGCKIIKMSQLQSTVGNTLADKLCRSGLPKNNIDLDCRAKTLIEIVTKESFISHQKMFGWTQKQSLEHNQNLGITMGFVGRAIFNSIPSAILIHNEAFISRGALNNLFNDPKNPLPVICLKDLLELKKK